MAACALLREANDTLLGGARQQMPLIAGLLSSSLQSWQAMQEPSRLQQANALQQSAQLPTAGAWPAPTASQMSQGELSQVTQQLAASTGTHASRPGSRSTSSQPGAPHGQEACGLHQQGSSTSCGNMWTDSWRAPPCSEQQGAESTTGACPPLQQSASMHSTASKRKSSSHFARPHLGPLSLLLLLIAPVTLLTPAAAAGSNTGGRRGLIRNPQELQRLRNGPLPTDAAAPHTGPLERRLLVEPGEDPAVIAAPQSSGTEGGPPALARCIAEAAEQSQLPPITWDRAMKDELGSLQVHAVWWSRKAQNLPITIVTQLSASRLSQLSAQCKGWHGPLSAAVYIPLVQPSTSETEGDEGKTAAVLGRTLREMEAEAGAADGPAPTWDAANGEARWLQEQPPRIALTPQNQELIKIAEQAAAALHSASERMPWACALSIVLVYEITSDPRAASLLYPVNQLRNMARLQARTELIAQLDVDMLISADMVKWMAHGNNSEEMVQASRNKQVYVMPAFETHGRNTSHSAALSDKLSKQSKRKLADAMTKSVVTHFDAQRFPQGHNTTDFMRWFSAREAYAIKYTYRYEPWTIVHRTLAPWHDVRFRGYGNNKIQQVSHLNATGHTFLVHPVAFIIHRAHALTEARKQLITDLRQHSMESRKPGGAVNKDTLYGHTKVLFEAAKDAMDRGDFQPVLDPGTTHCISTLPWYKTTA